MIIYGGDSNRPANVNSEGRLLAECVSSSIEHHINHSEGQAYNAIFEQSPTANDDCIFYMANNSDTTLVVEGLKLSVSAACEVYVQKNAIGTRNSGTAITPVNMNFVSGNPADCTAEYGADLDGGAATLTGGTEFERFVFRAASDSRTFNFEQDIAMAKNNTITIWCSSSAATLNATVILNFHGSEQHT